MSSPSRLPLRPEVRIEKVEDLVERVRRGLVRIPLPQCGPRWQISDVVDLFDSLYQGYPIGSLLFLKRRARADRSLVGPLVVEAPETSGAWWVVDGRQRVVALTVCLTRSIPLPAPGVNDPYVLFFDAESQKFESPATRVQSAWVPVPCLLDAERLLGWLGAWQHRDDEMLRRVVFDASERIREYAVPLCSIETEDGRVAAEIYGRIHRAGKALAWSDIHKALWDREGSSPSTIEELSKELEEVGMGRLDEERLLNGLNDAAMEALPTLRRVLSFLRRDAGIPHLLLLPKPLLLDVLIRFFRFFADPGPRTRTLLARWYWRTVLGAGSFDDQALRRRGLAAIGNDEEASVQELLLLVHKDRPQPAALPEVFDARADESRIVLLALVHLGPRLLPTGEPVDIAGLLGEQGTEAFAKILPHADLEGAGGAANRLIQPKGDPVQLLLCDRIAGHGPGDPVLGSHGIDGTAAALLVAGDLPGFLARRAEILTAEVRRFSERMAAWDHNDRPSLEFLLAEAGVEA
jgi:hypothetical protein